MQQILDTYICASDYGSGVSKKCNKMEFITYIAYVLHRLALQNE